MAIACAYCGTSHATSGEVRACWQRHQGATVDAAPVRHDAEPDADWLDHRVEHRADDGWADDIASESRAADSRTGQATAFPGAGAAPAAARQRAAPRQVWIGPGPEQLARGIVIVAGDPVPSPWAAASRVVVDRSVLVDPEQTVAMLQALAAADRRAVVEVAADVVAELEHAPRSIEPAQPYELGPRFWFPLDVLHHLVWANAIDATTTTEPGWALLDRAVQLGATVLPPDDPAGDVRLPDGTTVWLDGGPIRRRDALAGVPVLHAVSIEHGSLRVPRDRDPAGELAPDQRAAVVHAGAAARIIAPAGSGKTRVLTERARHLLEGWQVPPSALSLVAFNKRAQIEMQERTTDLRGLRVRTLNAIALAIVNGTAPFHPQPRSWRTIDEVDVRRIIGRLVQFPRRRNTDPVAAWIEALSVVRLGLRTPDDVETMYGGDVDGLAETWPKYRAQLERDGLVDFDDQVYRAIQVLLTDPEARHAAQRACRLLLVDEFQDLTPAHILLVRLLSAPGFGVFGVGDDDQTIYGYSGARPEWLINFAELFPDAGAHPLEVNYRCPGDVVVAADRLVRHNRRRVAKTIRSIRPDTSGLHIVRSEETLLDTLDIVEQAVAAGRAPADIAVLVRVNALLAPVQVGLAARGIAVSGGVGAEFLERTAIRASLAWLRLAVAKPEGLQSSDLAEALRRPSRPMHPNVANWVAEQTSIVGLRRLAGRINTERDAARVAAFTDDITRLQRMAATSTTAEILDSLADDVGLGAAIATLDDGRHGMNRAAQNDDLVAMGQLAALHPDPGSFGSWLRGQIGTSRSDAGVVLATVHRVKGQEWPLVVVHHAEADQYPHRLAEDVEEERRVFHVAITRGSEHVYVVAGSEPSPFVADMGREPPERVADAPISSRRASTATPSAGPSGRSKQASSSSSSSASTTLFDRVTVIAAPGLVIVDGGQEWTIESVEDDAAVARQGGVTRRFSFGSSVVTVGRQRGPLRAPIDGRPSPASVRAHDLLRQARERLRSGKPAYVVYDDKTLEAIALALPTSLRALGAIAGIGPAKLEQYGDAILLAIEDAVGPDGTMP